MSLLAETQHRQDAAPSKWAGKVRALACAAPWWTSSATVAVCEVDVAQTFTALIMVNRSSKSGKLFAAPYSTKRGDSWVPNFEFTDPALGKEVERVAVAAVEAALLAPVATNGGAAQAAPDDEDSPF